MRAAFPYAWDLNEGGTIEKENKAGGGGEGSALGAPCVPKGYVLPVVLRVKERVFDLVAVCIVNVGQYFFRRGVDIAMRHSQPVLRIGGIFKDDAANRGVEGRIKLPAAFAADIRGGFYHIIGLKGSESI